MLHEEFPRVDVVPFESARRFMATVHRRADGTRVGYLKGAVEEVLVRCPGADRDAVLRHQRDLAAGGLRVLAFARFTSTTGTIEDQVASPNATP